MLEAATILFAIAAAGGALQAWMYTKERQRPWILSLGHLTLAAAALVVLAVALMQREAFGLAGVAFLFFLAVALGGFILLGYHAQGRRLPPLLVASHGVGAVVGFVLLLIDTLTAVQPGESAPL